MSEPRLLKIFICHSSTDKPAVRDLYKRLRAVGWLDVWLDEDKLYPGQDWNMEIERAVEDADAILVCLSRAAITKEGYVQRELRIALDYADYKPEGTLYIIPVRLEECDPPRRLRMWQYASYFPEDEREPSFQRLLVSLRKRAEGLGILTTQPAPQVNIDPPAAPSVDSQPSVYIGGNVTGSTIIVGENNVVKTQQQAVPAKKDFEIITLDGIEFCRVPAGEFVMGSDEKEENEKPAHVVNIPYDYWMARFPVTNRQYQTFMQEKGGKPPVIDWRKNRDHPVVNISWNGAMQYCQWLHQRFVALRQLMDDLVLRLPSEAEWEKAARGTDARLYPWGDTFDAQKCHFIRGRKDTGAVSEYPAGVSLYGCEQMLGNVWEWTHSLYDPYPYRAKDGREDEQKSGARVLRGGSFLTRSSHLRCAYRLGELRTDAYAYSSFGFRVVLAPAFESASSGAG